MWKKKAVNKAEAPRFPACGRATWKGFRLLRVESTERKEYVHLESRELGYGATERHRCKDGQFRDFRSSALGVEKSTHKN